MNRRVDPQTLRQIQMVRAGIVYAQRRPGFKVFIVDAIIAGVGIASFIGLLAMVYFGEELWQLASLARNASGN